MKKKVLKLGANPKIIEWSIKTAGWETSDFLAKISIGKEVYDKWLNLTSEPTLNQLKIISERTKRPIAVFFLEKVPEEKPMPKDFRLNPKQKDKFDKKTIMAIRKARKLQVVLRDFGEKNLGEIVNKLNISTDYSPIEIALSLRNKLEITEDLQKKSKSAYNFFKVLREKLENEKIFNFQISMPLEDARGFALSDDLPRIIVVNSKDNIEARIFTLAHELGHAILGDTEISNIDLSNINKNEKWCNEFASAFLLPPDMANRIFEDNKDDLIAETNLTKLSRKYKVSKSMLIYNMVKLKFVDSSYYEEWMNKYSKKVSSKGDKKGGVGISADKRCVNELGETFISIVSDNLDKHAITYSDALDYLSIKSRNFDKLIKKA